MDDLTSKRFGRLTVMKRGPNNRQGHPQWYCQCSCKNECLVSGCNLRTGNTQSCGCLKLEIIRERQCLRPFESLYRQFVRNAAHPVRLSYKQFFELTKTKHCHYCEAKVSWKGKAYNLDRKNNKLAYTIRNVVVCCKRCNIGKSQYFTYEEWVRIGNLIKGWKK